MSQSSNDARHSLKFYSRTTLQLGGIQFNPSPQGLKTSVGLQGFSFHRNAKGNYIHLGQDGMCYYTATKTNNRTESSSSKPHNQNSIPPLTHGEHSLLFQDSKSKRAIELRESSSKELVRQLREKQKKLPFWPLAVLLTLIPRFGIIICILLIPVLYFFMDRPRKTTLLYYDITPDAEEEIQLFYRTFNELVTCNRAWYVSSRQKVNVVKYQAGASWLVTRKRLRIHYSTPRFLNTNILVPWIPLGSHTLYFLPDQILDRKQSTITAIPYSSLKIGRENVKFIEEQSVASDSKNAGSTWRFVNIDGSPDRRFKYNHPLPILSYSELTLTSGNILHEVLQFSKPNVGFQLQEALRSYPFRTFLRNQITTKSPN